MTSEVISKEGARVRLWNVNFFLLWQGQFVSALGDVAYSIALGFWILAMTGSTALMGTLMATATLPRIFVAPFAGVIVDRSDRKWLLVMMDAIRGAAVVAVGIAAWQGSIQVWMVFVIGVIIGVCSSFFNPAVSSILPDIVVREKIIQANSVFRIVYTASDIIGNSVGGFIFKFFGAPLMFLFNGLSYLFSAGTEIFIRVPRLVRARDKVTFLADLKHGFAFVWRFKGLRALIILASVLNFCANMGLMLILPLFERYAHLGPAWYGIVMAFFTGGMLAGFLVASIVNFKPAVRFKIFSLCFFVTCLAIILFPLFLSLPLMILFAFIAGMAMAILNSFIAAVLQITVPQDKRGKVFGLSTSIATALTPIAFAIGGVLAEFVPIRALIAASFMIQLVIFLPLYLNRSFRAFINFDPDNQSQTEMVAS